MTDITPAYRSSTFEMDDESYRYTKAEKRKMRKIKKNDNSVVVPFKRALETNNLEAKTSKQKKYINAIKTRQQVIVTGSAGTGKTYIAARMAVEMLLAKKISKIIITRPNVASGRSIGFFPGTLLEKMEPWVAPITSVIKDRIGASHFENLVKNEVIEVVPFEVMRGRTFENAFVLLDEAQNCTLAELKMFITRIGEDSKVVLNGDVRQTDLNENSGLKKLISLCAKYDVDAEVFDFTSDDIVRSGICKQWVIAFEKEGL